eukprot:12282809-Prorocentrum_lima.AAC.1
MGAEQHGVGQSFLHCKTTTLKFITDILLYTIGGCSFSNGKTTPVNSSPPFSCTQKVDAAA